MMSPTVQQLVQMIQAGAAQGQDVSDLQQELAIVQAAGDQRVAPPADRYGSLGMSPPNPGPQTPWGPPKPSGFLGSGEPAAPDKVLMDAAQSLTGEKLGPQPDTPFGVSADSFESMKQLLKRGKSGFDSIMSNGGLTGALGMPAQLRDALRDKNGPGGPMNLMPKKVPDANAAASQPGAEYQDPGQQPNLQELIGGQDPTTFWDTPKQPQSVKDTVTDQATVDSPQTGLMPNVRETVMRGYKGTMLPAENMGIPGEEGGDQPAPGSNWSDRLKSVMSGLSLDDPRGQALMAASLGMLGAKGTYGNSVQAIGQGGLQGMGAYQQARQTQSIDKYRDATLKQQSSLADRKERSAYALKAMDVAKGLPAQGTAKLTALRAMAVDPASTAAAQQTFDSDPDLVAQFGHLKFGEKPGTLAQEKGDYARHLKTDDPAAYEKLMQGQQGAKTFSERTLAKWNEDPSQLSPQEQEFMRLWKMGKTAEAQALALRITNSDITGLADDSEEKIQNMGINAQRLNEMDEPPVGVPRAGQTPGMVAKPAKGQAPSVASIKAAGAQVKEKHPDWTDRQVAEEVHRQLQGQ